MKELIEKLKAAEQNSSGMFEIDEDTICSLMGVLVSVPEEIDGSMLAHVHLEETTTGKVDAYVRGFNACVNKMRR